MIISVLLLIQASLICTGKCWSAVVKACTENVQTDRELPWAAGFWRKIWPLLEPFACMNDNITMIFSQLCLSKRKPLAFALWTLISSISPSPDCSCWWMVSPVVLNLVQLKVIGQKFLCVSFHSLAWNCFLVCSYISVSHKHHSTTILFYTIFTLEDYFLGKIPF